MDPLRSRRAPEPAISTTTNSVQYSAKPELDYSAPPQGLTNRHKASLSESNSLNKNDKVSRFWTQVGGGLELSSGENRVLLGLILLAGVVRLWQIGRPSSVV